MVSVARLAASLVLVVIATATSVAQTAQPPQSPQQAALTAAQRITDPGQRLKALEGIRAEYPNFSLVDLQLLTTLAGFFPERTTAIQETYARIVGRIPPTSAADTRLTVLTPPTNQLIASRVALDYAEPIIAEAVGRFELDAYAKSRRDVATRTNQAIPSDSILQVQFNTGRARGLELLGRVRLGRGDTANAERALLDATVANPAYGVAASTLVDIYTARKDFAKAEEFLKESIRRVLATPVVLNVIQSGAPAPAPGADSSGRPAATTPASPPRTTIVTSLRPPVPAAANSARIALADLYLNMNETARGDSVLNEVLAVTPNNRTALLALARVAAKQGNTALSLERYAVASLAGALTPADMTAMRDAYRASKGSDDGLDAYLDHLYEEKYPNPVKPQPWDPSRRTNRVVLLEMFTGSACGPCVASDLALDAAMARYPADVIAPIVYHANIPGPDPMVVSSVNEGRRFYYHSNSVPRILIDGAVNRGGGARGAAQGKFDSYVRAMDSAMAVPATAAIEVAAVGNGDKIEITANVTKLPGDARDLRLHVVLVEKMLRFSGENGIRFHPMVARAVSAGGKGEPISKTGKSSYTFSLEAIKKDVMTVLDADIARRRSGSTSTARFAAEGNAYTAIDTTQLMVVAFVQSGAYTAAGTSAATNDAADDSGPVTAIDPTLSAAARSKSNILQAVSAPVVFRKR